MASEQLKSKKIILIGNEAVGKTSIRRKFMGKSFNSNYLPTVGADFSVLEFKGFKLTIWDIAGEPNYELVRKMYYQGAKGAILVFDITREDTLTNLNNWINNVTNELSEEIPYVVVGNKEDLRGTDRKILNDDEIQTKVDDLEKELNIEMPFYYSSAKTGLNVEEVFIELTKQLEKFDNK